MARDIRHQEFSAKWRVLHLNRNYPQFWTGAAHDLACTSFGVKLFSPVDVYQKSMRTAKYALLFIAFYLPTAFFLADEPGHPVQYLLIGFAMIVFYTLLLSISEHSASGLAYLLSAAGVTVLIAGYAKSILKHPSVTRMVGALLVGALRIPLYPFAARGLCTADGQRGVVRGSGGDHVPDAQNQLVCHS